MDHDVSVNQDMRLAIEWLHVRRRRELKPFHLPVCLKLEGSVDAGALEASINEIVRSHAGLRATFANLAALTPHHERTLLTNLRIVNGWKTCSFRQYQSEATLALTCRSSPQSAIDAADPAFASIIAEESGQPFCYERAPLFRATLLAGSGGAHALILVFHHLIADLHSVGIFLRDLRSNYRHIANGDRPPRREVSAPTYLDYVQWQRATASEPDNAQRISRLQVRYEEWIPHELHRTDLRRFAPDQPCVAAAVASQRVVADREAAAQIIAFCRRMQVTVYVLFLSAFYVWCALVTGREAIVSWSMWANRVVPNSHSIIGWLAERRLLGATVDRRRSFNELLEEVRRLTWEAGSYQHLPAGAIEHGAWLRPPAETAPDAVHVGFDMAYRFLRERVAWTEGLLVSPIQFASASRERAIKLFVSAQPEVALACVYPTNLLSASGAQMFVGQIMQMAHALTLAPDSPIGRCEEFVNG